jgi:hypothetical protein
MYLDNWIRKDGDFLGFANPGTPTDTNKWMIVSATTELRDFADNDTQYDKIWDDRVEYFTAPSVPPSFEYSAVTSTSFDAKWSYVSGVTKYYITLKDDDDKIILGYRKKRLELTPQKKIIFRISGLSPDTTYNLTLSGENGKGSIETSLSFKTDS